MDFTRPELKTRSIYANQDYSRVEDFVACWSVEMDTCEELMRRGYKYVGTVNIAERAKELEREITRLEDARKLRRGVREIAYALVIG